MMIWLLLFFLAGKAGIGFAEGVVLEGDLFASISDAANSSRRSQQYKHSEGVVLVSATYHVCKEEKYEDLSLRQLREKETKLERT